ncbi:MAG: STAS domain-containing protein [Nitrospira sp. LK70]|nr:STAS domain-containing protein [Nitrospira sp. LK70]
MLGMCDPLLAACSMLLGGAAAYVILSIAERMRAPDQGPVRARWLLIGAVAAGLEIWVIHYVGNLAFCPPVSAVQDSGLAVLSLLSAGATGAVAVYIISSHADGRMRLVSGGMLMGACMIVTHFSSMMAVHQPIDLQNDLLLFVLSVAGIVGLSIVVLTLGAWNIAYGNWRVTEKASAMGFALSGSHLIGMIPMYGISHMTTSALPPGIEVDLLAVVAVSLSTLLAIIDRQVTAASSLARDSHARMTEAIESVPQWFALFDPDDRLVICNRKYREVVSGGGGGVQLGDSFESIIRRIAERGDIPDAIGDVESWIQKRLDMHHHPQGLYMQYRSSGEWIQIHERKTHDGGIVFIATDITALKRAEQAAEDAKARLADSLALVEAAKSRMQEELNVGRDIQQSMLPRRFPAFPDRKEMELYAVLEPALEIGGDLYDFFLVDDHRLCFVIGDVSGNGVPAALFMAMTKIMVKTRAASDPSPASIVTHVNDALSAENDACMFVTLYLGILNLRDGTLLTTNAGHNPPLLKRRDGQFEWLTAQDGPLVGPMPGIAFKESFIQLGPGDELFLYTDGVTEADNRRRELFGKDRLKTVLDQSMAVSVVDRISDVMKAVKTFAGDAPQADDITILGIRYLGVAPSDVAVSVFRQTMLNQLSAIPVIQLAFERYVAQWERAKPLIPTLNMALDDLLNNIVQYAFPHDPTEHTIGVEGEVRDECVTLTMTDDGIPFNPLTVAAPDLSLLLHEREIGGLGIHLVRSMFDEVTYHRNVGRNVLTVKKKLVSDPSAALRRPDQTGIRIFEGGWKSPQPGQDSTSMAMSVTSHRSGDVMIVTPQNRFDTNSAPEAERILTEHIERGERRIILDLARISYISSIGLRVILKAVMSMTRIGGRVVLSGGTDHVRAVLQLTGALMMSLHASTLEDAISKVRETG